MEVFNHALSLVLALSAMAVGAAELDRRDRERLAPFLGLYQGAFDTAVTATPLDDMNVNPCPDCETHAEPLRDIYLQLQIRDGRLTPTFHRDPAQPPIDLLGQYCESRIGPMTRLDKQAGTGKDSGEEYAVITATFNFDPGRCTRNIAQNKQAELSLVMLHNLSRELRFVRVEIDKDLRRVVTLTAKNRDGERVPVKSNPNDYGKDRRETRSFVYEDEVGEDSHLRSDTVETRYFALPLVLNGYVAANLTWWPHKILDVEAETEEVLTRHTGVFMPLSE